MNPRRVLHETIDGEVVAIDLADGTYYSLRGSAARIFGLLERGLSVDDVVTAGVSIFDASADDVRAAVTSVVDELVERRVLVSTTANGNAPPEGDGVRVELVAPVIERFTDMQDLILLDPVHDVSDEGWPHTVDGT